VQRNVVIRAFLISPLVPVFWFIGITLTIGFFLMMSESSTYQSAIGGTLIGIYVYGLAAAIFSYGIAFILGVPGYFLTKRLFAINRRSILVGSTICGAVGTFIIVAIASPSALLDLWFVYPLGGLFGVLAGKTFGNITHAF